MQVCRTERDAERSDGRTQDMRALMVAFASAGLFAFGGTTTSSVKTHVLGTDGMRAVVPVTWHLSREVLSVCSSPAQVMAIANVRGPGPKRPPAGMVLVLLLAAREGRSASM